MIPVCVRRGVKDNKKCFYLYDKVNDRVYIERKYLRYFCEVTEKEVTKAISSLGLLTYSVYEVNINGLHLLEAMKDSDVCELLQECNYPLFNYLFVIGAIKKFID